MAELQTLAKALDVLTMLGENESNMSVEEIAKRLDIPESTVYRLLKTLETRGFIEREARGSITLGYAVLNLARDTYEKRDRQLSVIAVPVMEEVTHKICETSLLSVRSGIYSTCLRSVPCKERIRFVADERRLIPVHQGSAGRAILAYENEKIIEQTLRSVSDNEERELVQKRIKETKAWGYAVSCGEYDEDTLGIAVPIFDIHEHVYASLAVVGPEFRIRRKSIADEIYPVLLEGSRKIMKQLQEQQI